MTSSEAGGFSPGKGHQRFLADPGLGREDGGRAAGGAEHAGRQVSHFSSPLSTD